MAVRFQNPADERIREILGTPRSIAVVGCSAEPTRDSHRIAQLLQDRGHLVFPVNPRGGVILERPVATSLQSIHEPIEMIDVFRRPDAVAQIVDEALAIGSTILWLQLGVVDKASAERATEGGMTVVMDRCPSIEYRRLFQNEVRS